MSPERRVSSVIARYCLLLDQREFRLPRSPPGLCARGVVTTFGGPGGGAETGAVLDVLICEVEAGFDTPKTVKTNKSRTWHMSLEKMPKLLRVFDLRCAWELNATYNFLECSYRYVNFTP